MFTIRKPKNYSANIVIGHKDNQNGRLKECYLRR